MLISLPSDVVARSSSTKTQVLDGQVQHNVRNEQTDGAQWVGDFDLPATDFAQGRTELGGRLEIAGERYPCR
ncbi:hypothetical protein OG244_03795 [Streptomyces brevispora]|uniref:hypothetical protein n=1 Tax=Streptomyces brevispora TaxID=887462 RepID=UPI002E34DC79|nr:hypothetical protein [Streptomyces brevispora]